MRYALNLTLTTNADHRILYTDYFGRQPVLLESYFRYSV